MSLRSIQGYGQFCAETDPWPVTSHSKLLNFVITVMTGGGEAS
jgi:hypothetical protein